MRQVSGEKLVAWAVNGNARMAIAAIAAIAANGDGFIFVRRINIERSIGLIESDGQKVYTPATFHSVDWGSLSSVFFLKPNE